jgi:hypothetical protein
MHPTMLLATTNDGNEVAVGMFEYSTGLIHLIPKSELNQYPKYRTSDNQTYWALKTALPDIFDESKFQGPTQGANQIFEDSLLVGYIRRSNEGADLKISINVDALSEVKEDPTVGNNIGATTLAFSKAALLRVIKGERAITTVVSAEGIPIIYYHDAINRKSVFDRKA